MSMIDPKQVPVQVLVTSFLKAMIKNGVETCVIFKQGTSGGIASNHPNAEVTARSLLNIADGAIEVAAVALHASRLVPVTEGEPAPVDDTRGLCTIVVCAGHELAQGKQVSWDELPNEIREAHRLVAKAAIGAAVAHKPPPKSPLVTA